MVIYPHREVNKQCFANGQLGLNHLSETAALQHRGIQLV
jgi:hypothetical protein